MAKKAKVALNVLVAEGTRQVVKDLADTLECSQGEVVDRAVVLLSASEKTARGLAGISLPVSGDPVVLRKNAPQMIRSSVNGEMVVDTPRGGLEPFDGSGRQKCRHCGTENAIAADARPNRPCPPCFKRDHRPFEPCSACIKEQHQKEMAEKHGTENVDYTVDWGA